MVDSTYGPTRRFCDEMLTNLGIETTYYDPLIGAGIGSLMRPHTKVVFLESPGSQTFDIQDVPAIVKIARERGAVTIMDNTWATPLLFKPLEHGVDVSVLAATKYIVGHADAMLGTITATPEAWPAVNRSRDNLGGFASPDDCYLGLRGLRTLALRLARHEASALQVARWLDGRPEVARVLHPALPHDPGHDIWRRDFTGASGLFGAVFKPCPKAAVDAFLNATELFEMGYSWGGFESLIIPTDPAKGRTATAWTEPGPSVRIHIGLEDPDDLIADLEQSFARMAAAA
jgi:cystathionine beta-lyase